MYLETQQGTIILFGLGLFLVNEVRAEIRPEQVHVAHEKKTSTYLKSGVVTGGSSESKDYIVKDIRWAHNAGYDRTVVELAGIKNGEPAPLLLPPFYHVAIASDESQVVLSLFGHPKININPRTTQARFKKSTLIGQVDILAPLEGVPWTSVLRMKPGFAVEVFQLSEPLRIVVDIKPNLDSPEKKD